MRDASQTTFTWSLPKHLKGELAVLADMNTRPLSNWMTWRMTPYAEALLQQRSVLLTDSAIQSALTASTAPAQA